MASRHLVFEHDLELPPTIVWDALVDPELVSGWLGEAQIEPVHGGAYQLSWLGSPSFPHFDGRIDEIAAPRVLTVSTTSHGRIGFRLTEQVGGARGTWTRLRLEVVVDLEAAFEPRVRDNWLTALDQLEQLLRGHPVDWSVHDADPGTLGVRSRPAWQLT